MVLKEIYHKDVKNLTDIIFMLFSQDMRQQANETGEAAAIPITVRQLEAIVRLSESLAKMKL